MCQHQLTYLLISKSCIFHFHLILQFLLINKLKAFKSFLQQKNVFIFTFVWKPSRDQCNAFLIRLNTQEIKNYFLDVRCSNQTFLDIKLLSDHTTKCHRASWFVRLLDQFHLLVALDIIKADIACVGKGKLCDL